ncbi:MAG TPA: hypothetical protein VG869_08945 [Acidimicrobiia bacterium]|nr:hypothetical protein [Acidimicrobiia bacterium]
MSATPALLAAAGVAVGHAVLPDHWVPLAVVGRTQRYSLGRVTRLASLAGVAHVLTSLVVGALVIAVGLQFRSVVEGAQNLVVGAALVITGLALGAVEVVASRHHGHGHGIGHDVPRAPAAHEPRDDPGTPGGHAVQPPRRERTPGRPERRLRGAAAVMVPFGAAASPDLTILPVFLAATTAGVAASIGTLLVFALVTVVTIVALTISASLGGRQIQAGWLDRWGNAGTAAVLVVVGALVLTGVI